MAMDNPTTLIAGALDQVLRHQLSGCPQAAHQAARLLDAIAERPDVDQETRYLCGKMSERLEAGHV